MADFEEVELKDGETVEYKWMDPTYGRAEFDFCVIWKRNRVDRVHIYPRQQPTVKKFWTVKSGHSDTFNLESWSHKGIEQPHIWRMGWCREHKTMAFSAYVPRETHFFRVEVLSTSLTVHFERREQAH